MKDRKGEEAPDHNSRSTKPDCPMSHVLNWITDKAKHAGSACMQHLSGPAAPLLVACLCLALAYKDRKRMLGSRPVLHRSVSMGALHGGRMALQRILDSQEARVNKASLDDAARRLRDLLADPERINFKKLQKVAAKLEMSGKEGEAVEMLRKAWEKVNKDGMPHEAHELQMLLVEMLIYKGDFEKALDCKCLQDVEISDARGPLYKAVIYTLTGDKSSAKEYYKEFQNIRSRFYWPDSFKEGSPLHGVVHDFTLFEKIVNNLKREIEHAHKIKAN